ncbi:hypothetical protein QW180_03915 [Vibrio sinaloensis]|nr:hypothetical protein [Vibrio sinaloensis]
MSALLAGIVYWRSRIMTRVNRQLKAQVALKKPISFAIKVASYSATISNCANNCKFVV